MKKLNKLKVINGMAWCGKHKTWHPVEEFYTCNRKVNGYRSSCKEIDQIRNAGNNASRGDGFWTVYELPGGHIGQTCQFETRMTKQRSDGRDTVGVRKITICESLEEALRLEAYHQNLSDNYDRPDSRKEYMKYIWNQITNYLKN